MRRIIPFFVFVLLCFSCNKLHDFFPLPSSTHFNNIYGGSLWDRANAITKNFDGGYTVAGYTGSNNGDVSNFHGGTYDVWTINVSKDGHKQWQQTLGGSNFDYATSIATGFDGGYIIAGATGSNDGDVTGFHGGFDDAWIIKLDRTGGKQWQKSLGGSGSDHAKAILTDFDGGYVMAGETNSHDGDINGNNGTEFKTWIVKLDCTGTIRWQKLIGSTFSEGANALTKTIDGGYAIAGYTGSNDVDVSIIKLDRKGNLEWQKTFGGSHTDYATAISICPDGGYAIAGFTDSNDGAVSGYHGGNGDAWIVKLNKAGNIEWQKALGGSGYDYATSITTAFDGSITMAGWTESNDGYVSGHHANEDAWIVKLNREGTLRWQKTVGGSGSDIATAIIPILNGGYVTAGYSNSNNGDVSGNHGDYDAWIFTVK